MTHFQDLVSMPPKLVCFRKICKPFHETFLDRHTLKIFKVFLKYVWLFYSIMHERVNQKDFQAWQFFAVAAIVAQCKIHFDKEWVKLRREWDLSFSHYFWGWERTYVYIFLVLLFNFSNKFLHQVVSFKKKMSYCFWRH